MYVVIRWRLLFAILTEQICSMLSMVGNTYLRLPSNGRLNLHFSLLFKIGSFSHLQTELSSIVAEFSRDRTQKLCNPVYISIRKFLDFDLFCDKQLESRGTVSEAKSISSITQIVSRSVWIVTEISVERYITSQ